MYPKTVELFYSESKAAREALDETYKQYRSQTTTVLALATGAAAFFGFEDSSKGGWYVAALVAYGVGALLAALIFLPKKWLVNPAHDFQAVLSSPSVPNLSPTKATYDMAVAHQVAFATNRNTVENVARLYRGLVAATALVVILAGVNVVRQEPDVPDKPTRVILVEE